MEFTPETVALGLIWYVVFLFSATLHEAAHAFAAWRLGDPTAYHGGQVTLNPLPHVAREPIGTILVPVISYFGAGWMMGWASAPYDPLWAARHPRRAAWMALAGPVSNLLVVVLAGLAIRVGMWTGHLVPPQSIEFSRVVAAGSAGSAEGIATLLSILFALNLLLFAFNLLPLPPLDGVSVLALVIDERKAAAYRDFMSQPGFGLLGLLLAWKVFGEIFSPLMLLAINLLYPEVGYTL